MMQYNLLSYEQRMNVDLGSSEKIGFGFYYIL